MENGSRPVASTRPSRTSARACPPSIPEYQAISTAGTDSRQFSMSTAPAARTATTVRGVAGAAARSGARVGAGAGGDVPPAAGAQVRPGPAPADRLAGGHRGVGAEEPLGQ